VRGESATEALALALAAGATVQDAAQAAGLSPATAYRRLAAEAFKARVRELRAEMTGRALGRMTDGLVEAADRLLELVRSADERVALGAARSVLEFAPRLRQSEELEREVEGLRRAVEELSSGDRDTAATGGPDQAGAGPADSPAESEPGAAEERPGQPAGAGRTGARPVAGGGPALASGPDVLPLLPPGG
jgi:hypothetical protein